MECVIHFPLNLRYGFVCGFPLLLVPASVCGDVYCFHLLIVYKYPTLIKLPPTPNNMGLDPISGNCS